MEQKRRTSRRVAAQQDTSQHIQTGHELSVKWHHSPINNTLPPEVLHHICVLAAGINLISVHARRTLGYMRLVCQSWCRAASRLCHRRTVATTAVHARQLLEAVIQDTKKTTTIARTTFFAKDVTELILRSSAACDERVVVAAGQQLCVAVRRLTNLTALEWHMPARLPMECIRALAKYSKLTSLEMNDVRYNDFSDSVAQPCFPELANLVTLQRLTVRFGSNSAHWVCRSGGEWFKFCASLSALESLQHLAIEFTGAAYHVEVRMYHGESFVSFLRQHPSLESLQLDSIFDWSCLRDAYFAAEGLARRLAVAFKDPTAAFLPALHTFSIESAGHLPSIPVLTEFICQIQTLRRISSVSTIHLGCFIDAPPASLPPSATPATQVVAVRLVAGSRNELNTCIMGSMKAFVNLESLHILVLAKSRVDVEEIWETVHQMFDNNTVSPPVLQSVVVECVEEAFSIETAKARVRMLASSAPSIRHIRLVALDRVIRVPAHNSVEDAGKALYPTVVYETNIDAEDIVNPTNTASDSHVEHLASSVEKWPNCIRRQRWPVWQP